jgi:type VI secretion system protein ImpA
MSLRDGTPTADAETKSWIENEVLAGVAITYATPAAAKPNFDEPAVHAPAVELGVKPPQLQEEPLTETESSEIFDQALQQAREGRAPEAIASLARQLASEVSGRGRFKRRVQIAHLLMASGSEQIAQPILHQIAQEIESRKLEEWEIGEAVAYPLSLLLRCTTTDEDLKKRMYAAVCRLDPARALQITV